jgi:hypothetical protein
VLAINLPFFYWFHRLLVWDVASAIHDLPAYRQVGGPVRAGLLLRTVALYPLSLLPLVGLLLQVAFVLVLTHYMLARASRHPVWRDGLNASNNQLVE